MELLLAIMILGTMWVLLLLVGIWGVQDRLDEIKKLLKQDPKIDN